MYAFYQIGALSRMCMWESSGPTILLGDALYSWADNRHLTSDIL